MAAATATATEPKGRICHRRTRAEASLPGRRRWPAAAGLPAAATAAAAAAIGCCCCADAPRL